MEYISTTAVIVSEWNSALTIISTFLKQVYLNYMEWQRATLAAPLGEKNVCNSMRFVKS
jgi:hypothetical protein